MLTDLEIRACSRRCCRTEAVIRPGEEYFSALEIRDGQIQRADYSISGWEGPPTGNICWWRSKLPGKEITNPVAPNEALLQLFLALEDVEDEADLRYVLALLLIRRRVLREEPAKQASSDWAVMSRDGKQHTLPAVRPDAERIPVIEERLRSLIEGRPMQELKTTS